jgi:hypothetical protein
MTNWLGSIGAGPRNQHDSPRRSPLSSFEEHTDMEDDTTCSNEPDGCVSDFNGDNSVEGGCNNDIEFPVLEHEEDSVEVAAVDHVSGDLEECINDDQNSAKKVDLLESEGVDAVAASEHCPQKKKKKEKKVKQGPAQKVQVTFKLSRKHVSILLENYNYICTKNIYTTSLFLLLYPSFVFMR